MSKFDHGSFHGGCTDTFAVSKEKYTEEAAIRIAEQELDPPYGNGPYYLAIGDGYARHRAGWDDDGNRAVCWWLEYEEHPRSCPCWVFHLTKSTDEPYSKDYRYIRIEKEKKNGTD